MFETWGSLVPVVSGEARLIDDVSYQDITTRVTIIRSETDLKRFLLSLDGYLSDGLFRTKLILREQRLPLLRAP